MTAAAGLRQAVEKSPHFAGIRIDGDTVEVWTSDADDGAFAAAARAQRVPVRVRTAERSWTELTTVRDRIGRDAGALRAAGVDLVSWGPDLLSNGVVVTVTDATRDVVARLRAYAPFVTVREGVHPRAAASRLNDASPYNAGDAIAMDNGGDCSAGPSVKNSAGKTFLLTAGHCYSAQRTLSGYSYRTFNGAHMLTGDAQTFMGYAAAERVDGGYDTALIDTRSSGLAWRTGGTNTTGTAVAQKREWASVIGAPVCASGAFSGERCGATVTAVDQTVGVCQDDLTPCTVSDTVHMVTATNNTTDIVGPGDSGGPVYQVHTDGVWMTGVIIATNGGLNCTRNNIGARTGNCGTTVFYQNLSSVLNRWGLTLYAR
jgi:hypothetical protein